jgi:hypothetical protein
VEDQVFGHHKGEVDKREHMSLRETVPRRVNCKAIGVPGMAANSKMPILALWVEREDVNQEETQCGY